MVDVNTAKVQKEWSRFHSDVDDVVALGVKKDCHLELMPNKQFHQGTLSDPVPNHLDSNPCFEGHSVHRQEAETTSDKASKQIREWKTPSKRMKIINLYL